MKQSYLFPTIQTLEFWTASAGSLRILNGIPASLPVIPGDKQGCPLSPLLFALFFKPLLVARGTDPTTRGLNLPGSATFPVSPYADDVTLCFHDTACLLKFLELYRGYRSMPAAHSNLQKCTALRIGGMSHPLAELQPASEITIHRVT